MLELRHRKGADMAIASGTDAQPSVSDTHHVTVVRSGRWWAIKADNLPGGHSQARRRAKVKATAREAIALWFDAEEGEVGPLVLNFDH